MIYRLLLIIIITGFNTLVLAQEKGLKSISSEELKVHLEFIASDSLQGRRFGTDAPGLDIAADYLALNNKKIGLKPGCEKYFQTVDIISSEPNKENTRLIIKNKRNEIVLETDSLIGFFKNVQKLTFRGEIVFAGFGWQDSVSGYNDFDGLNLEDKIVIYSTGSPDSFKEEKKGKYIRYNNQLERAKWSKVMEMGAKGIILVTSPYDKGNSNFARISSYMNRSSYSVKEKKENNIENNIVLVTSSVYDSMVGKKGALKSELDKSLKNSTSKKIIQNGFIAEVIITSDIKKMVGKNVIGIVEGSDPKLKDECIVFTAHYDHLGIDNKGNVYNGADDNGSGTVTLLEVAEAFMALETKPKRSIVFLWVTCEEIGMLGSQYYTENPVFPLENTVACINLDMVGRVYEKRDKVWERSPKLVRDFKGLFTLFGNESPQLVKINDNACKKIGIKPDKSLPENFLRSSDHYSFYSKGVPIINYATGYHADYHKVSDDVSKINFKKMKKVAELCFLVGFEIANTN